LDIFCSSESKYIISNPNEFLELVIYISQQTDNDINVYLSVMATILLNKQTYIQQKFPRQYFGYLVQTKKLLKDLQKKVDRNIYTPLDVLYEITNKKISLYLNHSSVSNLYKSEIDQKKMTELLEEFYDDDTPNLNLDFEEKLLCAFLDKN